MMVRLIAVVSAVFVLGVRSFAAEPVNAKPSAVRTEKHTAWGFQVQVPRASTRHSLKAQGDTLLSELYTYGDLIYVVRLTRTPANTLASTAVEQETQKLAKASAVRWEISSRQGDLFKGLSRLLPSEELDKAETALLKKALWGRDAVESMSMAPLAEDAGPILTVGVIGPRSRKEEIENTAKFMAYGVERTERTPARAAETASAPTPGHPADPSLTEPSQPGDFTVRPPQPRVRNGTKRPQDSISRNSPVAPAPVVLPKPRRVLRKGEIELVGSVESIDGTTKSMVMLVDEVVMPGLKPIPLDPARRKTVYFRTLPGEVRVGSRIAIAGRNTGVGKPMTADSINVR
jgi:hypothetical protein